MPTGRDLSEATRLAWQTATGTEKQRLAGLMRGEVLAGFGRKPADHNMAAFQGIHARRLLVVFDEADGIPASLWDAAESLITNDDCTFVAIGNPDNPSSYLAKVVTPGSKESTGWHVIRISAFDAPCWTGEPVPAEVALMLTNKEWTLDKQTRWGETSPLYSSKVLAIHPKNVADAAIPWSRIQISITPDRALEPDDGDVLGVDVGGGGDRTTTCHRQGLVVVSESAESTPQPEDVYAHVMRRIIETGCRTVQIDSGGIGWGVAGMLKQAFERGEHRAEIVPVNAASSATKDVAEGEPKLANMRSQLWWWAREHVAGWDLRNCHLDTLDELAAPKWSAKNGRILVEGKDDLRKRIGKSPDSADALLLCFVDLSGGPVAVTTPEAVAEEMTRAGVSGLPSGRIRPAGLGSSVRAGHSADAN